MEKLTEEVMVEVVVLVVEVEVLLELVEVVMEIMGVVMVVVEAGIEMVLVEEVEVVWEKMV